MTKLDLLEFLKKNQYKYVSGEELAVHFGVTRAGVWKHIKKLQEEGVKIEGVTNKGYKLAQSLLCEDEILGEVDQTFFGDYKFEKISCEVFESIDSTNTYAKTKQIKGLHLYCSSEQTAGRGRRGNEFYSPKNTGVYFSLAFNPKSDAENIFTVAAAVATNAVLSKTCGENTKIKWVNDIYFKNRKVCGILTEGTFDFETAQLSEVIVGIGINLETTDFPDDIATKAGSLGAVCNHNKIIGEIMNEFFKTLSLSTKEIIKLYSENSMVLGNHVEFLWEGKKRIAIATHFTLEGNLVCQSGEKEYVLKAGEISVLGVRG
ncbi:MAG: biotin--[acetyl-CoA-carboxylase] ligase [Bacillota bacterium]